MKTCFKCNRTLPISQFYTHPRMNDGHLGKCKECTRNDVAERYRVRRSSEEFIEKDRARGREKYHRLGYKEKYAGRPHPSNSGWMKKYPEKVRAKNLSQRIKAKRGQHKHHWSYKEEDARDVVILPVALHYKLHRFMRYDQARMIFRTIDETLLDSKQKHLAYLESIRGLP